MRYQTEELAAFAIDVLSSDIPEPAWAAAERAVLDTLAAIIGGVDTENAGSARQTSLATFGMGEFRPWFTQGPSLHNLGALFSNCSAASALDIDDGHRSASGHPGAAIVPAVLMEAKRLNSSGSETLAAIIIGYDVALRIGEARLRHPDISFASGIWTGYGVAAAIGRLRGPSPDRLAHAIAIAGAEAPQNLPQGACMASSVKGSSPWSTVTATVAVSRAQAGATGSLDLLDRDTVYAPGAITSSLGSRWLITETYHKPYASCRYTHPVIDAILQIRAEAGHWHLDTLGRVKIEIFPEARRLPNAVAPVSLEDAQFSIPFTAALAIVRGATAFRPLEPASLADPLVLEIARKIDIVYDAPEFASAFPRTTPARVTAEIGGKRFQARIDHPLGDVANPMGTDDIAQKIVDFDGQNAVRAMRLKARIEALRQTSVKELMAELEARP